MKLANQIGGGVRVMRRRRDTISVHAEVDAYDVLGELSNAELIDALESRKVKIPGEPPDLVENAYLALRRGDVSEALVLLERAINPKWQSIAACQAAFDLAIGGAS